MNKTQFFGPPKHGYPKCSSCDELRTLQLPNELAISYSEYRISQEEGEVGFVLNTYGQDVAGYCQSCSNDRDEFEIILDGYGAVQLGADAQEYSPKCSVCSTAITDEGRGLSASRQDEETAGTGYTRLRAVGYFCEPCVAKTDLMSARLARRLNKAS